MRYRDNIIDPIKLAYHDVQFFTNSFCFAGKCKISYELMEVIPDMVYANINEMLTMIPSTEEISNVVFNLNMNNVPGPDGFGGFLYQTYWKIIEKGVCKAIFSIFQYKMDYSELQCQNYHSYS